MPNSSLKSLALFSLISCFLLQGCASAPEITGLKPASDQSCIVLDAPLLITYKPESYVRGLLPGVYKAAEENSLGTFYKGDGRLVVLGAHPAHPPERKYLLFIGGVWIPKAVGQPLRLYNYFEPESYGVPNLDAHLAATSQPTSLPDPAQRTAQAVSAGAPVVSTAVGNVLGIAVVSAIIEGGRGQVTPWIPRPEDAQLQPLRHAVKQAGEDARCK